MREIKFRAWCPDGNRMEYQDRKTPLWIGDILTDSHYIPMQYTGRKDKNGKEIYEGDIVREEGNDLLFGPVIFSDEEVCFGYVNKCKAYNDPNYNEFNGHLFTVEVIGNIYENPNLLNNG